MATLERYDLDTHQKLAASKIQQIFETKIFYLIRGRNAWHSTWVTHYYPWSFHDNLNSAKSRAEIMRERGSVFTIREQPALVFGSAKGCLLLTEVNTPTPLSAWTLGYRKEKSNNLLNQSRCRLESRIRLGMKISSVGECFNDREMFPEYRPSLSKGFLVLASANPTTIVENARVRLKNWGSSSIGADYYLHWSEGWTQISGRSVRRVAHALSARLKPKLESPEGQ